MYVLLMALLKYLILVAILTERKGVVPCSALIWRQEIPQQAWTVWVHGEEMEKATLEISLAVMIVFSITWEYWADPSGQCSGIMRNERSSTIMASYNVTLPCSGWRIHTSQIQQLLLCQSLCSVLNRGIRSGLQPASHGLRKNNAMRVDGRAASIQVISMKLNAIVHYSILQQYRVSQPHSVIYRVYTMPLFCLCSGSGVIPAACQL